MDDKNRHLAKALGYKYLERSFFDYPLLSYGSYKSNKSKKIRKQRGVGEHIQGNRKKFKKAYKCIQSILDDDTNDPMFYNLYNGIFMFCMDYEEISFDDSTPRKDCEISSAVRKMNFPPTLEGDAIDAIDKVRKDWKFERFLEGCRTNPYIICDIDSALDIYKMQGDEAIFGILMQVFTRYDGVGHLNCQLIPDVDIKWYPDIDDFASGTTFPVFATPYSKELRWQTNENGIFLETKIEGEWLVLDCINAGHYFLGRQSTSARSRYWAGGGLVAPYRVCWNWSDLIEAVKEFGTDVLVRDFRTDLFSAYWHRFGLGAKIVAPYDKEGFVARKGEYIREIKLKGAKAKRQVGLTTLAFDDVKATKKKVIWGAEELLDWGEISRELQDTY